MGYAKGGRINDTFNFNPANSVCNHGSSFGGVAMMTRKDYVKVAEILQGYQGAMVDQYWFEDLANDFADFFASDNPNFKRDKFLEACNVN